jgi:thiamine-phosphate pyrophosphorylase
VTDFRLYLVAGEHENLSLAVQRAISGGITMVQLRLKQRTDRDILETAHSIQGICRDHGIPLVINDRIDLALVLGADGVHLGVDDLPLEDARNLAPPGFLIGYSPETEEQLRTAQSRGATYLGIGPVFATTTKPDAGEPLGLAEFHRRCTTVELPVVGIGGINAENAGSVIDQGAAGVAVASAILSRPDIETAARELSDAIRNDNRNLDNTDNLIRNPCNAS